MKVLEILIESKKQTLDTRDKNQLKKDYSVWKKLINIPNAELKSILKDDSTSKGGLSAKDKKLANPYRIKDTTARAIIRLRTTPLNEWHTADVNWMYRMIKYVQSNAKRDDPLLDLKNRPTAYLKNLWAWGRIPNGLTPSVVKNKQKK